MGAFHVRTILAVISAERAMSDDFDLAGVDSNKAARARRVPEGADRIASPRRCLMVLGGPGGPPDLPEPGGSLRRGEGVAKGRGSPKGGPAPEGATERKTK
eukprot:766871-Prorocentrum_minimum.AAC.1